MSSGNLNPIDNPQSWDVIQIGQSTSPGVCIVRECKRPFEFEVKKGKGSFGATVTFVGRPPAKVSIEFLLWEALHFTHWDNFRPLLKYDPTKKAVQAVDVYHPSFDDIDFRSVVVESIGSIVHKGKGLYSITVEVLEYFPAPKVSAVSTPTMSQQTQPDTTPGTQPDPVVAQMQKEFGDLANRATAP
jgi:hypothetical protein